MWMTASRNLQHTIIVVCHSTLRGPKKLFPVPWYPVTSGGYTSCCDGMGLCGKVFDFIRSRSWVWLQSYCPRNIIGIIPWTTTIYSLYQQFLLSMKRSFLFFKTGCTVVHALFFECSSALVILYVDVLVEQCEKKAKAGFLHYFEQMCALRWMTLSFGTRVRASGKDPVWALGRLARPSPLDKRPKSKTNNKHKYSTGIKRLKCLIN